MDDPGSVRGPASAWGWLGADDEATVRRALADLRSAGVISDREECSVARASPSVTGSSIPWASWAVRICERAGIPAAAGPVAVAVTVLCCSPGEGAMDALTRGALAARVLATAAGPAAAQAWLLALSEHAPATAPENPPDAVRAAHACGTREAVALWTAAAAAAGGATAGWARFGERLAEPIQALGALARLWIDPAAPDLEGAALTALLGWWLRDADLGPAVLRAYAGERASPGRRFEIHNLAASRPARACVSRAAARALEEARAALEEVRAAPAGAGGAAGAGQALGDAAAGFLEMLARCFGFHASVMEIREMLARAAALPERDAAAEVGAAVELLRETAPWPGSWEVQRFGLFGSSERPVGQWFARGMILQALAEMGHEDRAAIRALIEEIPPGELRYFGDFRGIPPDADDLGLMLQLAARIGERGDRVASWIEVMLASAGADGVVPTWFYQGPRGPTVADPPGTWPGDDCTAVRLNLLIGLLDHDAVRLRGLIEANAARVLARHADGALAGAYHYDDAFTALLFLRFARRYREEAGGTALAAAVLDTEGAVRRRLAGAQRLDGGWGSPQRTAACLEGCALEVPLTDPLRLERGMRSLAEAQLANGAWAAEPLYRAPLKGRRVGHHQGRELTTALCARALEHARATLEGGAPRSGQKRGSWRAQRMPYEAGVAKRTQ